jgi:hypothetical protein
MRDDERAHDRETETGPRTVSACGPGIEALELLEDLIVRTGRDARPMVRDPDLYAITFHEMRADQDLGAGRREAQRVLEQVEQDLVDHRDVEPGGWKIVRDIEPDAVGASDGPQSPDCVLDEAGDVDRFLLDLQRTGADAAQLEGVAHQPLESFRFVGDRLEQFPPFLGLDPRP